MSALYFVISFANIDIKSIITIDYLSNIRYLILFNSMGLKERLIKFIEYKGIDKAVFERNAGLSNGFVDKSGENTRKSSLDKISNAYPDLNLSWLKTGEGNMLKNVPYIVQEPVVEYGNKNGNIKDKYIRALEEKEILLKENYELKLALEKLQKNEAITPQTE